MSDVIVVEVLDTAVVIDESDDPTINVEILENPSVAEVVLQVAQVVEVSSPGPQGTKGDTGDPGSSITSQYTHHQMVPSTRWAVSHSLSRMPTAVRAWEQTSGIEVEFTLEDPALSDDPNNIIYLNFQL